MSRRSRNEPTGRVELLLWINDVCGTSYPSVESLRDAVAYATVLDAAISRRRAGDGPPEGANLCRQLRSKFDEEVTALVASSSTSQGATADPASDSIQVRERCERNFHLLQSMLRQCLPKGLSVELDVTRLAAGKLQEHLRLLQWCVGFVKKWLAPVREQTAKPDDGPREPGRGALPRSRSANAGRDKASKDAHKRRGSSSGVGQRQTVSSSDSNGACLPTGDAREASSDAAARAKPGPASMVTYEARRYVDPGNAEGPASVARDAEDDTVRKGSHDTMLAAVLRDVEALEAEAWARAPTATGPSASVASGGRSTNNLETVRDLLHERDVLWHTLTAIEAAVWRAAAARSYDEEVAASSGGGGGGLINELMSLFEV